MYTWEKRRKKWEIERKSCDGANVIFKRKHVYEKECKNKFFLKTGIFHPMYTQFTDHLNPFLLKTMVTDLKHSGNSFHFLAKRF